MSFNQLADNYFFSLVSPNVSASLKPVYTGDLGALKKQALDQLFRLNPQYNRDLLDGDPNTQRGKGVNGLDPDAVKVGAVLSVGTDNPGA